MVWSCQLHLPKLTPPTTAAAAAAAAEVASTLQHASSVDVISQYYVFPETHNQSEVIVCDAPESTFPQDPELPLSGKSSLLQTIFSVWASRKPDYLCARVPVSTHWDLNLLGSLIEDFEDKQVVEFLRYGWPMSRSILPLTNRSAKVNHKETLEFPDAINHILATEHSNNTLLGPFFTNPFPDRTASSPLNSMPKRDSDEHWVILNMTFPSGHSVNDGIDKDHYLGVTIDLSYPTLDSFATMLKAVGPRALMYKRDLCWAYCQIWTDPFDVPYQGFSGRVHSTLTQY